MEARESEQAPPPVEIREAEEQDLHFILNSWKVSLRKHGHFSGSVPNAVFFRRIDRIIVALLKRCLVLVAHAPSDRNAIAGYAVGEIADARWMLVHWVYVKDAVRQQGIASLLLDRLTGIEPAEATFCTMMTNRGRKIASTRGWIYDPFLLFATLPRDWMLPPGEMRRPLPPGHLEALRAAAGPEKESIRPYVVARFREV